MLHVIDKEVVCTENGCPTNFHSSTLSSNFLSFITEQGARISARVLRGRVLEESEIIMHLFAVVMHLIIQY